MDKPLTPFCERCGEILRGYEELERGICDYCWEELSYQKDEKEANERSKWNEDG